MRKGLLFQALAAAALLLSACGGGRDAGVATRSAAMPPPAAAKAPEAACSRPAPATGLVVHRSDGQQCLHSFTGLDGSRAKAAVPQRLSAEAPALTPTELFDWAEQQYPQYFPSHESNLTSAPYVYRYYPGSQNYAGVADGQVYVLGPISGGELLHVGSLDSFLCSVRPQDCGRPCAAITRWQVGNFACTPNEGQAVEVLSGRSVTYTDSTGGSRGSAAYSCNDGTMTPLGTAVCEAAVLRACNTAGVTWSVGGSTCTANSSEPAQIPSGSSRIFNASTDFVGNARLSCQDGTLSVVGTPTCAPAPPASCQPNNPQWSVGDNTCHADTLPTQIALGEAFTLTDSIGATIGSATYICTAGGLVEGNQPVCTAQPRMIDSFGGDGGAADGGAAGDGTAGDGAPIVGGLVKVVDRNGRRATATTNNIGYFRVNLTGFNPPLVVSVTRPDGVVRHSVSTQALKTNGYIFIAVTGLTDKIASDIANAAGFPGAASLTPTMVAANPAALTASINALRNDSLIRPLLEDAGVDPDTFNPLSKPFRADGTGYDKVLDNIIVTTDESGTTVVRSADCEAPSSWTVDGVTCTPDEDEETIVPNNKSIIHTDSVGSTRGTVGWTCVKGVLQPPVLPNCRMSTGPSLLAPWLKGGSPKGS